MTTCTAEGSASGTTIFSRSSSLAFSTFTFLTVLKAFYDTVPSTVLYPFLIFYNTVGSFTTPEVTSSVRKNIFQ